LVHEDKIKTENVAAHIVRGTYIHYFVLVKINSLLSIVSILGVVKLMWKKNLNIGNNRKKFDILNCD